MLNFLFQFFLNVILLLVTIVSISVGNTVINLYNFKVIFLFFFSKLIIIKRDTNETTKKKEKSLVECSLKGENYKNVFLLIRR